VFSLWLGEVWEGEGKEDEDASSVVDEDEDTGMLVEDSKIVLLEADEVVLGATPMVVVTEGVPGKLKNFLPSSQLPACAETRLMQK
jgi:hypothetical protein